MKIEERLFEVLNKVDSTILLNFSGEAHEEVVDERTTIIIWRRLQSLYLK